VGRQESWLSRVQLHSTDLHHGLKTVGSLFKNAFLTRVHRFLTRVHSCSSFLTRVHSCSSFLTRVHSCSSVFDSCSLVFTRVLTRVHSCCLVFTRVHSCSLVFTRVHSCSDSCGLLEQIYIIRILQHSATKLWNITNFVMKFLSRLIDLLVNWGWSIVISCRR
jgi:hypothetical protein